MIDTAPPIQAENTAYWDSRASDHHDASTATFWDVHLREREIQTVCQYLGRTPRARVLDVGCGNGYGTFKYAARFREATIRGEDISAEMIRYAQDALARQPKPPANLAFGVGNVVELAHPDESFDAVSTCRVLINLGTAERQRAALREVHRVLAPGGVYLLLESFRQSYARLSALRQEFGLPPLAPHQLNLYLDEDELIEWCRGFFKVEEANPFSSTYYVGSRVAYPLVLGPDQSPRHDHPVNRLFALLASTGDYGREKLYVLRRLG